ncbi:DUF2065 domain-containing protein [Nitratireductor sp. ZSWI3]|uniref:DUF2065 domain-containing protein n=1 Tax=Nitratireductor sp. ZSWI3 TaxID=2966359 RepID=UPI00214F6445|nr:DUF2065 domain-containing protein [Nitratireductor sp. ZSWI3]MCR4267130.1 DUF2065 domain-containing protein [Nitratireductor sp. ZSWI3]
MNDFIAALGLVLVIEGLVYGGMPRLAKRLAEQVIEMPESTLRTAGITAMIAGVFVIWFIRG